MKFDIDTFREIGDALLRNRRRSLLTGFGIFWGLFMLLFLIGGGDGLKQMMMNNFEGFASNTGIVIASSTSKPFKGMKEGRSWNLNQKDIERLKTMVPELDVVSSVYSMWGVETTYGKYTFNEQSSVKGVYPDYTKIEAPIMKYGRFINEMDVLQERKVCVIGKKVWEKLFPSGENPCGKFIKAGAIYYEVIGVNVSNSNMSINGHASSTVVIPASVARKIMNSGNNVDIIAITGKGSTKMKSIEPKIRQVLAREHQFDPEDMQAVVMINTQEFFSLVDNLFRGINVLIWLVGLGTLLAGAIGVSNIMMVTVKERTVEIGIRRAIGATPNEILSQIMMESVTLTTVAGVFGIAFSVLALALVEQLTHTTDYQITLGIAVVALLLLTLLGVLAGLAPALRAMKIKAVDAMRDE